MNRILAAAAACALMLTAGAAAAGDGDDYEFVLVNRSSVPITQFNGYAGGAWSSNWLSTRVAPGGRQTLRFNDDATEDCSVRTRVTFADGSYFEDVVDYCGISSVIVSEDTIWTE